MKSFYVCLVTIFMCICFISKSYSAPSINRISGDIVNDGEITINGSEFSSMNGYIVSWDNFENHTDGTNIANSKPVIGPTWTTQFGYNGDGAEYDNERKHSGSISAKLDWSIDSNTIRAFGWTNQGPFKKLYISYWRYQEGNFIASTSNHKQFYLFGNGSNERYTDLPQGMPLIPAGTSTWGFYNNVGDGTVNYNLRNNINNLNWVYSNTSGRFQRWEFWVELNEPYTESNGIIKAWLDGKMGINNNSYRHRYVDGEYDDFRLGHMASGFNSTAKAWFDDLYIATTPARVELGNSAVFDNCTHREVQIVKSWNNDSIVISPNIGSFTNSEDIYLFVIDSSGNVSSGHNVNFVCPKPPKVRSRLK